MRSVQFAVLILGDAIDVFVNNPPSILPKRGRGLCIELFLLCSIFVMVVDERINLWVPTVLVVALLALHSGQLCLTVVAALVWVACQWQGICSQHT